MLFKSLTRIGLVSLWLGASASGYSSEAASLTPRSLDCNPSGRVVKVANSQLPIGKVLCQQDKVQISAGEQVHFICFSSSQEIMLNAGTQEVSEHCREVDHQVRRCTSQNPTHCPNFRNPAISPIQTLLIPFSSTMITGQPRLQWEKEPEATSYRVRASLLKNTIWEQTVTANSMDYPTGVSPLQPGKAYLIQVSAFRDGEMISENESVLNRISDKQLARVRSAISSINSLDLTEADKILDQDRILVSQDLLSESIEILKAQVEQDKTSPILHRLLGDRYMNAGLPVVAQPYFQEAELLAREKQNQFELAKAQEGLAEIVAIPFQTSGPTTNQ